MIFRCDVAQAEDWQGLWTHAEQTFDSQVTLLVNNAGLFANWQKSLDIMLYGVCHGTWLAIGTIHVLRHQIFGIFGPPPSPSCVSMFLVLRISKNWHFLTPPLPPYKC